MSQKQTLRWLPWPMCGPVYPLHRSQFLSDRSHRACQATRTPICKRKPMSSAQRVQLRRRQRNREQLLNLDMKLRCHAQKDRKTERGRQAELFGADALNHLGSCWTLSSSALNRVLSSPVFLSGYLPVYLSSYLSSYQPVCPSVCRSIYHLSVHLLIYLSIYPSIYLSTYPSIYLSVYAGLSIRQAVCLSVCLAGCLSVC